MSRKCHAEIATAWMSCSPLKGRMNVGGTRQYETDGVSVWYRGNKVAKRVVEPGGVFYYFSNAGWGTPTTRAIVNALAIEALGTSVVGQVDFEQVWYGERWQPLLEDGQVWHIYQRQEPWDFNAYRSRFLPAGTLAHPVIPSIVCHDGFTMSVQASRFHYCSPRNGVGPYTAVEVGFPSQREPLLGNTGDSGVWGYVPLETVQRIIWRHGGFSRANPEDLFNEGE